MANAIEATGLVKHYGSVIALDGLDLIVPEGTILALLGPNGAGKTTAVSILTTLLEPDAGEATVAGADLRRDPHRVRTQIGLSGQSAALDEQLTGRENLEMIGRLYRFRKDRARARAGELLEGFDLTESANRPVKTYSGGMRRRLDLACALVAEPKVLFLDEPTTGLDPRSRTDLWHIIHDLVGKGTTLLLTTQYLEEADRLADDIVVIDHGRKIAHGTSDELKSMIGGERIEVTVADPAHLAEVRELLTAHSTGEIQVDETIGTLVAPVANGSAALTEVVRHLGAEHIAVDDIGLRRPTLDDVFLSLTGHHAEDAAPNGTTTDEKPPARAKKGR